MSGSGISWAIYKSVPRSRQITMPAPHHSVFFIFGGGKKGIWPVKKQSGGVLAWLSVWSDVQTCIWPSWCHCYSLSLAPVKSRLVLPFWYRLTQGVKWLLLLLFLPDALPAAQPTASKHWRLMRSIHLKVKVARTRLPSVGFRSWSRFLAVSLQVTWVIYPAVGCHYFPPGPQLPS